MSINIKIDKKHIRAFTGSKLNAKSWLTEAPLRMLLNNLDPQVAEDPQNLIVYGGIGKAARSWECFDKILDALISLNNNETLLIQSGKPVGIFTTHEDAPRVLLANSNIVPAFATWETFHELDRKGLMMFGQMTAGSWIYIGSQGILQGTYETFMAAFNKHYQGQTDKKWILTSGLGGMGGAQPLAATMAKASILAIECDKIRIEKRLQTGYLDRSTDNLSQALLWLKEACTKNTPISVGLLGNACEVLPKILQQDFMPHLVTDQTSAHDPLNGYLPEGYNLLQAEDARKCNPERFVQDAKKSMAKHVKSLLEFQAKGIPTFDYGNNIRQVAFDEGIKEAFNIKGFVPLYIRPLFCRGIGPFRWVALSGDKQDIYKTDEAIKALNPHNQHLHEWLDAAQKKVHFQGLPARICWLGLGERAQAGLMFNDMVKNGQLKAPIVIGRDHLDSGSVASPNRETEGMKDSSDKVSDWPLLNALLNCASGATWVSIHHGGGVGMGFSQHSGVVVVADGTTAAERRIKNVLTNDPATGVMRHADAGYQEAVECAHQHALKLPMING